MDLNELLGVIEQSLENIDEHIQNAEGNASEARGYADSASDDASEARDYASNAESAAEAAKESLETLGQEFEQLKEMIQEFIDNEAKAGEKPVALSDMQQDIKKYSDKVRKIRADNPKISISAIADHLKIGEFLVRHILETKTA